MRSETMTKYTPSLPLSDIYDLYIHIYIYIYVCMYVCIYIYIFTYVHSVHSCVRSLTFEPGRELWAGLNSDTDF